MSLWRSLHLHPARRTIVRILPDPGGSLKPFPEPAETSWLMTQPDSVAQVARNQYLLESGFLARWLYVYPKVAVTQYSKEELSDETARSWEARILQIMQIPPRSMQLELSREALDDWIERHDALRQRRTVNVCEGCAESPHARRVIVE